MLSGALEQAFLFLPLVFGVHLSYRVLKITDLTTEGSFILGAALFSICIDAKQDLFVALLAAICGGIAAGCLASLLQRFLHFSDLIAGILVVFVLHSVSLKWMGRPNVSLYDQASLLHLIPAHLLGEERARLLIAFAIGGALFLAFLWLLSSKLGLVLRAFGNNPKLLELFGKNEKAYCFIGLALSNSVAALGGALTAQFQGFADIGMGAGVVLIALSAVIIGQRLCTLFFRSLSYAVSLQLLCCFLGIFLYFLVIHLLIKLGIDPINLKMAIALVIVGILSFNRKLLTRSPA